MESELAKETAADIVAAFERIAKACELSAESQVRVEEASIAAYEVATKANNSILASHNALAKRAAADTVLLELENEQRTQRFIKEMSRVNAARRGLLGWFTKERSDGDN